MALRYIKNPKTGRFAGSIGEGKTRIPQNRIVGYRTTKPDTSENFYNALTAAEKIAVSGYLNQDYMELTPILYGDTSKLTSDKINQIRLIDNVINRYHANPANHTPKTVYRATKIVDGKYGTQEDLEKALKEIYPIGGTVNLKGFTSTTQNHDALFDFLPPGYADSQKTGLYAVKSQEHWNELNNGYDPAFNNIIYSIDTTKGLPVHAFGQIFADKEQEYLLPRESKFRVTKVEPYTKVERETPNHRGGVHATIIHLTQI